MRTPLRPRRLADERLEGQGRGRVASERDGRGHEGEREALGRPADRGLREHQPDARATRRRPRGRSVQRQRRRRVGEGRGGVREATIGVTPTQDDVDRTIGQQRRIVAQPGGDRPAGGGLQALDEAAHDAAAVLECEPRVALAPLAVAGSADTTADDAQGGDPPGIAAQPARRQQRVQQRQAERRFDRCRAEVLLDARQDALDGRQRARRPEVEDLVGQPLVRGQDRESARPGRCGRRHPSTAPGRRSASALSVGTDRDSGPPT